MRILWIILIVVVATSVAVLQYVAFPPEFAPPPEPCDSSAIGGRDYSIYRTILDESIARQHIRDEATIFVAETTKVTDTYLSPDNLSVNMPAGEMVAANRNVVLSQDTISNFLRLSTEVAHLDRQQFADLRLVLTDQAEVDDVFESKGGWEALGASTIVRLSRIGFSCDGSQALVYRSRSCGTLCGSGDLVVLEKSGNQWQLVLTKLLWIS